MYSPFDAHAFTIDNAIFPPAANESLGALITIILKVLLYAAGALSFIFIIIGGFKIVTSSGDSKKLSSAQATILYAIIGVIVCIMAIAIINFIQKFFGSSVEIIG